MEMANDGQSSAGSAEGELVITRVFDAPRELVFKAWTEPEHFVCWWGPKGYPTPFCTIECCFAGLMPEPEEIPKRRALRRAAGRVSERIRAP